MDFDIKTWLIGLLLGIIAGLGFSQIFDKNYTDALSALGSFLGGLAGIGAATIAFLALKRWKRQHNYSMVHSLIDDLKESFDIYGVNCINMVRDCWRSGGLKDDILDSFKGYDSMESTIENIQYIESKILSLIPKNHQNNWQENFGSISEKTFSACVDAVNEANFAGDFQNKSDLDKLFSIQGKIYSAVNFSKIKVMRMNDEIGTIFK